MRFNSTKKYVQKRRSTKIKVIKGALLGLLVVPVLLVAQAEIQDPGFKKRAYVGLGFGPTVLTPKTPHSSLTVGDDSDTGYHLTAGYDFTSRLSAEIYVADFGAAGIDFLGTDVGDINYTVAGVSAIAYLLNTESGFSSAGTRDRQGLSLYARAGLGGVSASADSEVDYKVNHPVHLALGLGAEYGFKNGFAVRGELMALDTDQQYANLSILKRFGKVGSAGPAIVATVPAAPDVAAPAVAAPKAPAPAVVALSYPNVNFSFDSADLNSNAAAILDEVARSALAGNQRLLLEGHTDWVASESYNMLLSISRAENVRQYLISKGVSKANLSVAGFGESRPIASNMNRDGRAENRRVEIIVQGN